MLSKIQFDTNTQYRKAKYGLGRYYTPSTQFNPDEDGELTVAHAVTSLQTCPAKLRPALIGKVGHDVDIENSCPTIALQYLTKNEAALGLTDETLQPLREYVTNRKAWLQRIMTDHNVDRAKAKRILLICMFGGDPSRHLQGEPSQMIVELTRTFKIVSAAVCKHLCNEESGDERFKNLYKLKLKEAQEKAKNQLTTEHCHDKAVYSVFCIAIHDIEAQCIVEICRYMSRQKVQVFAVIHDGVITSQCNDELIKGAQDAVEKVCGYKLVLVEKPLHGLQDQAI